MGLKLGCIADDFTGATDLANSLVRCGWRVSLVVGVPQAGEPPGADVDAVVVSLKSRTCAVAVAVAQSLAAQAWLCAYGARQIYFKVCSTFDSTSQGNIGPVTDALAESLGATLPLVTPAFPENGRTVYNGHLFVGEQPLNESSMRHHPLTPMTDANLVRVLQAQSHRRVGLVPHRVVRMGAQAIARCCEQLVAQGYGVAIADAVDDTDLQHLGAAVAGAPLVTAGSGLALGLAANFGIQAPTCAPELPAPRGAQAILSASCSAATQRQVAHFLAQGGASRMLDLLGLQHLHELDAWVADTLAWAAARVGTGPVLVYATAAPDEVQLAQQRWGTEAVGAAVEQAMGKLARGLVTGLCGVGQLVVAGGETSGACVAALGLRQLRVGAQIDPGVPWCHGVVAPPGEGRSGVGGPGLHLALKSGNFGGDDFFARAFEVLNT